MESPINNRRHSSANGCKPFDFVCVGPMILVSERHSRDTKASRRQCSPQSLPSQQYEAVLHQHGHLVARNDEYTLDHTKDQILH